MNTIAVFSDRSIGSGILGGLSALETVDVNAYHALTLTAARSKAPKGNSRVVSTGLSLDSPFDFLRGWRFSSPFAIRWRVTPDRSSWGRAADHATRPVGFAWVHAVLDSW